MKVYDNMTLWERLKFWLRRKLLGYEDFTLRNPPKRSDHEPYQQDRGRNPRP